MTPCDSKNGENVILSAKELSSGVAPNVFSFGSGGSSSGSDNNGQWVKCGTSGIDISLLQEKDDILFYDDVILYQDDLEDCGEVKYSVKLRVMPKCWFLLSRVYLRIDNGAIRVRYCI